MIPGVIPDRPPSLSRDEIIDKVANEYGTDASKAHNYFLDHYGQ